MKNLVIPDGCTHLLILRDAKGLISTSDNDNLFYAVLTTELRGARNE
jgi:hypothetical protein